jgi:hypothetical protein
LASANSIADEFFLDRQKQLAPVAGGGMQFERV